MSSRTMPKEYLRGWVPTLNQHGFMATTLDSYSEAFVAFAGETKGKVLDIGCAYGVATLPALEKGASVTAVDMESKHLEVLKNRVSEEQAKRLELVEGYLPDGLDFPAESFDGILVSRVLHFMQPKDIARSMDQLSSWLKPGGKLFLVVETPYIRKLQAFIPTYEARRKAGAKWPGLLADFRKFIPPQERQFAPPRMNLLDPDVLHRLCYERYLDVVTCGFIDREDYDDQIRWDGREGAGVIAKKR